MIGSSGYGEGKHFRFDIMWFGKMGAPQKGAATEVPKPPEALVDPQKIVVRMHLPYGQIVEPSVVQPKNDWDGVGMSGGWTGSRLYIFAWQRNAFDEAWIEVRLPTQTYWVEIPYGFTRNPADPLPPAEHGRGRPALAPQLAMRGFAQDDRIVPWLEVEYDLGEIQNHWKLSPSIANPFQAGIDFTFYSESTDWRAHTPVTGVSIKTADGTSSAGVKVASRLDNGPFDKIDTFKFGAEGYGDDAREWGTVSARVDDKSFEFAVPSSLFKHLHGTADFDPKKELMLLRSPDLVGRTWQAGADQLFNLLLKPGD